MRCSAPTSSAPRFFPSRYRKLPSTLRLRVRLPVSIRLPASRSATTSSDSYLDFSAFRCLHRSFSPSLPLHVSFPSPRCPYRRGLDPCPGHASSISSGSVFRVSPYLPLSYVSIAVISTSRLGYLFPRLLIPRLPIAACRDFCVWLFVPTVDPPSDFR